ncbi:MAG TPA: hypothetical protein VEW48_28800 [Thermoanaerobaculia bacterium]|nr:hypothetical protein [Thermoanaerobaculia bacterium]
MPTLQRYKKMYQDRIPAEGKGRKQRYPENALPVFDQIRNENLGRRGRPRKDPNAPRPVGRPPGSKRGRKAAAQAAPVEAPRRRGRKPAAKAAPAPAPAPARRGRPPGRPPGQATKATKATKATGTKRGNLLTLTEISKQTGISYPTLVRYVRIYSDRLPHEGRGRGRRFYPEAVNVFRELRQESGRGGRKPAVAAKRRGRPPGSGRKATAAARGGRSEDTGVLQRLREIEKSHLDLEKRFRDFAKGLQRLFR